MSASEGFEYWITEMKDELLRLCNNVVPRIIVESKKLQAPLDAANNYIGTVEARYKAADDHIIRLERANQELEYLLSKSKEDLDKANARIAELEVERRWIPVSEPPKKSDWYLKMYDGYRIPDEDYYDIETGWVSGNIPDFWMPLPKPPEVK